VDLSLPLRPSSAQARRSHDSQQPIFADSLTSARAQVEGLDGVLGTLTPSGPVPRGRHTLVAKSGQEVGG
jgi:hypothetical protein